MAYLLDTNVMIDLLNGKPEKVRVRFEEESKSGTWFYLSSIVEFELRYGIAKFSESERNQAKLETLLKFPFVRVGFDSPEAAVAGKIRAALEKKGRPLGNYEVQIAAQAVHHGLILVSAKQWEFVRVDGLRAIDWSGP